MLLALVAGAVSVFPLPVLGRTWVVDDDAGPGVDFTTLQPAFDAAAPQDVILVQPGTYSAATLTKGVRVIGQGGPVVSGTLRVNDLPAGSLAVVSGFRAPSLSYGHGFATSNCAGVVVGEDLQAGIVTITNSLDVRLRVNSMSLGYPTLRSTNSRLEVSEWIFRGPNGPSQLCNISIDPSGRSAADVIGGELHASRCSFIGGSGGDSICGDLGLVEPGGDGGAGITVSGANARVLLSGIAANELRGGLGGYSSLYGPASNGSAMWASTGASAQFSGVTVTGSVATFGGGAAFAATPPDPTLRLLELPTPGTNLTLRLTAPPGSIAHLRIGAVPVVVPAGGIAEDILVARAISIPFDVVPGSGVQGLNYAVTPELTPGTVLFAQAIVTYPGGEVRRTHSIPIVVR